MAVTTDWELCHQDIEDMTVDRNNRVWVATGWWPYPDNKTMFFLTLKTADGIVMTRVMACQEGGLMLLMLTYITVCGSIAGLKKNCIAMKKDDGKLWLISVIYMVALMLRV